MDLNMKHITTQRVTIINFIPITQNFVTGIVYNRFNAIYV